MNHFEDLRNIARTKRDVAIAAIRDQYSSELADINKLEKQLPAKPSLKGRPKPKKPLRVEIMEVVPVDANFTVPELTKLLNREQTEHAAIRSTLNRLIDRGELKRVRVGRGKRATLYAVAGFGPEPDELANMSLVSAMEHVLQSLGRGVSATELTVALLDRGFQPSGDKRRLNSSVGEALSKRPNFIRHNDLWSFQREPLVGRS